MTAVTQLETKSPAVDSFTQSSYGIIFHLFHLDFEENAHELTQYL